MMLKKMPVKKKKDEDTRKAEELESRKKKRTEVFLSYACSDISFAGEIVRECLDVLSAANIISYWDDPQIRMEEAWNDKLQEALSRAKVIVMLASNDYIKYAYKNELTAISQAVEEEEAIILWLLIRDCEYSLLDVCDDQSIMPCERALEDKDLYGSIDKRRTIYKRLTKCVKKHMD